MTWIGKRGDSLVITREGRYPHGAFRPYMARQIPFLPALADFHRRPASADPQGSRLWFAYGRTALAEGFRALALKPGSLVLVPWTICDVVQCALDGLSLQPLFYRVWEDLTVDWTDVEAKSTSAVRALLLVHYFGFPQDLDRALAHCRTHDLFLVEDNAHGHGAEHLGQPLGTFGHVGITSPRKTLGGLQNGAMLILNGQLPCRNAIQSDPSLEPLGSNTILKGLIKRIVGLLLRPVQTIGPEPDWLAMSPPSRDDCPRFGMDRRTLSRIQNFDVVRHRQARQELYELWANWARRHGLAPVFAALPPGCSPLCCPCRADSPGHRDLWLHWAYRNGIDAFSWPTLPAVARAAESPAWRNWRTLICLPINDACTPEQWQSHLERCTPPPVSEGPHTE